MRENRLLQRMLDRLYAAMSTGPAINCRPHHSRQRIDLSQVAALDGTAPGALVEGLLGAGSVRVRAAAPVPVLRDPQEPSLEELRAIEAFEAQQAVLGKLRTIADDARTWSQDHGAHVLQLGSPLLHVPPGAISSRRVLAPLAFVPVQVQVRGGRVQGVELEAVGEGVDRVVPNLALLTWVERQVGKRLSGAFLEDGGLEPWEEVRAIAAAVAEALEIEAPVLPAPGMELVPTRRSDDEEAAAVALLPSAVLGLFPLASVGLIRDTEAMLRGEVPVDGPVASFVRAGVSLGTERADGGRERLITRADPCQARAVRLARTARGLVIHGPPGSGKSQTIANIVGDSLARGERVLFVCDKRTALDVVHDRLDHLGLGKLCAVVHDPQRDQRDLYLGIREQLDGLAEAREDEGAEAELLGIEAEASRLHAELTVHHHALSRREGAGSFHELVGAWLAEPPAEELAGIELAEVERHDRELRELLQRARDEGFVDNPWREALGVELESWLSRPVEAWREALEGVEAAARAVDEVRGGLPFAPAGEVAAMGAARGALADAIEAAGGDEALGAWASVPPEEAGRARGQLERLAPQVEAIRAAPLDAQLSLAAPGAAEVAVWIARLLGWLQVARRWYGFLFFGRRRAAREVLERFGLGLEPAAGERVLGFLEGLQARFALEAARRGLPGAAGGGAPVAAGGLLDDGALLRAVEGHRRALELLARIEGDVHLAGDGAAIRAGLAAPGALVESLRASRDRAVAIERFEQALRGSGLFDSAWMARVSAEVRQGGEVGGLVASLVRRRDTIEGMIRIRALLAQLPRGLAAGAEQLLGAQVEAGAALSALRRSGLAAAIRARLAAQPALVQLDAARLLASHERLRTLQGRKQEVVRRAVLHRWVARQRGRLLAGTGTRLNGAGAEVRRRLMLRGERAMKVRQVIAAGQGIEGGDPIFDLRPVWMASPQTVAQIFPAEPLFDVVIFDEASQCRLEEALPVLLRARRVVIAGDPKQLPPTRFFESALAQSEAAFEAEDDQGLFEEQQSEVEDLLGAALNLEIEQSYLDVHYRSADPELIEFSNRAFYDARLQAIPAHPSRRRALPPIRLQHVGGTYDKRQNEREALAVVALVRELLAQEAPPSIGIACFNVAQRDRIAAALDAAAAEDEAFATLLGVARERRGADSFEGLFVKNLENVQGDERDVMIVSTTYGPDGRGRFYRRFGPLGMPGGGRRLNVLVTRARKAVHLLTSIPPEAYRSLPPLQPGQQPNGGWLLFAYLRYAEELAEAFRVRADEAASPGLVVHESRHPSPVARVLGAACARQGWAAEVHWGNEGFCVDVALRAEDEVIGVLVDGSRYDKAEDPVEWDLFRTGILEAQGWTLRRIGSPSLFRDPALAVAPLRRRSERFRRAGG